MYKQYCKTAVLTARALGPVAAASPGNLLERQVPGPHPRDWLNMELGGPQPLLYHEVA